MAEWWQEAQPGRVAVAKINIEGGEYEVLPRLIDSGLIEEIDEVQVQFHDVVPNAKQRMNEILADLALSHEPTYRYPFVWENWRRRARQGPPYDRRRAANQSARAKPLARRVDVGK